MTVRFANHAQTARRMSALMLFMIGVVLMVVLFYVKTRAQSARLEVVSLERQISDQEAQLKVLDAEIAFLENPARLRELSKSQLGLEPVAVKNVIRESDIETLFPLRAGSE